MNIEKEVRSSFDEWTKAWNEGDIERYLDGYHDSDTVRYVSGKTVVQGKDAISEHFRSRGAKGSLALVHFETNIMSDKDVLCFGQYRLEMKDNVDVIEIDDDTRSKKNADRGNNDNGDESSNGSQKGKKIQIHRGCFTCHLKKIDNVKWMIISDHSS